jgi:hypothetical protein
MVTQSAADGLVEEPAAVELAGAEAEADVAETDADADVAGVVGVELDEVQPAMRAPLAARTTRTVSDERRDISGTSMGVEHEQNRRHAKQRGGPSAGGALGARVRVRRVVPTQIIPESCRKASPSHLISRSPPR